MIVNARAKLNPILAAVFTVAGAPFFPARLSADPGPVVMKLQDRGGGTYSLEGGFDVRASSASVWEVLSDYQHLAGFVSSLKKSNVKQAHDGKILLEQEALGKVLLFSRRVRVLLKVTEEPYARIRFEDVSRRDFEFYRGSWEIAPGASGSVVVYRLDCRRRFAAPNFLSKKVLRKNARELLAQVRREILKRQGRSLATTDFASEELYQTEL
jgi:hypothetical protein